MKLEAVRLAFFISSFRAGGGERVMVDLANAFAAEGHAVDLLVLKPVGQYESQVSSSVRVVSLDAGRMIFSLPKLIAYIQRERPAVLLALDEYTHLLAIAGARLSGKRTRVILRIGNMYSELFTRYEGLKGKMMEFLVRTFYKYADEVIAVSKGVADDVERVMRIPQSRITTIYNPKDLTRLRAEAAEPVEHPWFTNKTFPIVIASGRLRIQKNFPVLIRVFAKVAKDIPARLVILGAGREEGRLNALIRELGVEENVALLGYAENPHAYFGKADVFASVSLWEGMPNALIEAMVCGLPIIAADCDSGPREVLAPDTDYRKRLLSGSEYAEYGVLTAVNDEGALEEALRRMLSEQSLRGEYAAQDAKRAEVFSYPQILAEYARVLLS